MSEIKAGRGRRTNHKRGIAAARKAERRVAGDARNAAYQKLTLEQKLARNSAKVRAKLTETPNEQVRKMETKGSPDKYDSVNHPKHYTNHPSGIECIQITRHMGFNLGNAMKYIWRADLKNGTEDLEKAIWYLTDEVAKRKLGQETAKGGAGEG